MHSSKTSPPGLLDAYTITWSPSAAGHDAAAAKHCCWLRLALKGLSLHHAMHPSVVLLDWSLCECSRKLLLRSSQIILLGWHAGCLSPVCLLRGRVCQLCGHVAVARPDSWPRPGSLYGCRQHSNGHIPDRWGCWGVN